MQPPPRPPQPPAPPLKRPGAEMRVEGGERPIVVRGGWGCSILAVLLIALFAVFVQSCKSCRPLYPVAEERRR